jgi:hypothetical protein
MAPQLCRPPPILSHPLTRLSLLFSSLSPSLSLPQALVLSLPADELFSGASMDFLSGAALLVDPLSPHRPSRTAAQHEPQLLQPPPQPQQPQQEAVGLASSGTGTKRSRAPASSDTTATMPASAATAAGAADTPAPHSGGRWAWGEHAGWTCAPRTLAPAAQLPRAQHGSGLTAPLSPGNPPPPALPCSPPPCSCTLPCTPTLHLYPPLRAPLQPVNPFPLPTPAPPPASAYCCAVAWGLCLPYMRGLCLPYMWGLCLPYMRGLCLPYMRHRQPTPG